MFRKSQCIPGFIGQLILILGAVSWVFGTSAQAEDLCEVSGAKCPPLVVSTPVVVSTPASCTENAAHCSDLDKDGIVDSQDYCPNEVGPAAHWGCSKWQSVKLARERIIISEQIYFAKNRVRIRRRFQNTLKEVAETIKSHPEFSRIVVIGSTDSSGDANKNRVLASTRAETVAEFLLEQGVNPSLIEIRSHTAKEANRGIRTSRSDRRVEFRVVMRPRQTAKRTPIRTESTE